MKNEEKIIDIMPAVGLKYTHFSVEELKWISNKSGISYTNLVKQYKELSKKYNCLKDVEYKLNNGCHEEILGVRTGYLKQLICFGRIEVTIKILNQINFAKSKGFYRDMPYIDFQFIDEFNNVAKNKLNYTCETLKAIIGFRLHKMFIYYKCKADEIPQKLDEFYEQLISISPSNNWGLSIVKNVLINMGYNLPIKEEAIKPNQHSDTLIDDVSSEFKQAFDEYAKYLESECPFKTVKTKLSCIRQFFKFLSCEYPEITMLRELNNVHIVEYKKYESKRINYRGKLNSCESINNYIKEVDIMLRYFISERKFGLYNRIVSDYDFFKETRKFPKKISREDAFKLAKAVIEYKDKRFFLERLVVIILIFTGRRIHEVLLLKLDSLSQLNEKYRIHFHKIKNERSKKSKTSKYEYISPICLEAFLKARERAKSFNCNIYSKYDGLTCRRLFPSEHFKGRTILSYTSVNEFFKMIQIENGIIDEEGVPKYTLHDGKRNFVADMLSAGITPKEISDFLGQHIGSLLPYEVDNQHAIKTLKSVEEKGLLIGKRFDNIIDKSNENDISKNIMSILSDTNIIMRNKENLIIKIKSPHESMPLLFATCTDNSNAGLCVELLCLACEEIILPCMEDVDKFAFKVFKHIYENKRAKETKKVEEALIKSLKNAYKDFGWSGETWFETKIKELKKSVRKEVARNGESK